MKKKFQFDFDAVVGENPDRFKYNPSMHYFDAFKKRPVFSFSIPKHLVKTYTKCLTIVESIDLADSLKGYIMFGSEAELLNIHDHYPGCGSDHHQHCVLLFSLRDKKTRKKQYFVVSHDLCVIIFPLMSLGSASSIFDSLSRETCSPHPLITKEYFQLDTVEDNLPF